MHNTGPVHVWWRYPEAWKSNPIVPEQPWGRERGPRPKALAATLTICLSAQDAASLSLLSPLIERAMP